MQDRLGEQHRRRDEPELEEHEEHEDPEADVRMALDVAEEPRDGAADREEHEGVDPGEHPHHLQIGQDLGERRPGAAAEERRAEHGRRVERPARERVHDEEPEGDGDRADQAGEHALLDERHGAGLGGGRSSRAGMSGHHPLLSGCLSRPWNDGCGIIPPRASLRRFADRSRAERR